MHLILLAFLLVAPIRPDPVRTPGAINPHVTQANIRQTVCVPGFTQTIRPPASYTTTLKRRQITMWHLMGLASEYEEDHRIALEIGGHPTDPKNLWPQPRHGHWNASDKDRLENAIHRNLCAGRLTLAAAQAVFFGDWVSAYTSHLGVKTGP